VMMNKTYPTEFHIGQVVRFLSHQNLDDMYIKPVVRKELENWMERMGAS
jgi:hypothetical protein